MEGIKLTYKDNAALRELIRSLTRSTNSDTEQILPLNRSQTTLLLDFLRIATESGVDAAFNIYPADLIGFTYTNGQLTLYPERVASAWKISYSVVRGILAPKVSQPVTIES